MKFAVAALLATTASATWGTWDSANYCDFGQEEIDSVSFTADEAFMGGIGREACAQLCVTMDQSALHIPYGTDECCDYEGWSDGSVDCTLYMGDDVMTNTAQGYGDDYASMTFESGDYNYGTLAAGVPKKDLLA